MEHVLGRADSYSADLFAAEERLDEVVGDERAQIVDPSPTPI